MVQRPGSLPEFEARFPDDEACARRLFGKRWPDGFRCPACGHDKGWELGRERLTVQCAACERQVSVTASTVMHRSHLPLKLWFLAAWLVATHKNGISARQLWLQLGLGSYKTAWLLLRKLRRAMVDPEREPLAGLVEVDETSLSFRTKDDPVTAKPGRSHEGRLLIAGAVEIVGKGPGRDAVLVRRHQPRGQEPGAQRQVAAVQHRPGGDRDLPFAGRALEGQPFPGQLPALVVAASRAAEPVRPPLLHQPAGAGRVIGEPGLELGQRSRQLGHPVPLPRARAQSIARQEPAG